MKVLVPVILRGEVEVEVPTAAPIEDPFSDRCPKWLEQRAFGRAIRDLTREGKTRKPGRRILYRPSDLVEWVDRHPIEREVKPGNIEADGDAPIPIETMRRRRARR